MSNKRQPTDNVNFWTLNVYRQNEWIDCLKDTRNFLSWIGKDMDSAVEEIDGLIEWYEWVRDNRGLLDEENNDNN